MPSLTSPIEGKGVGGEWVPRFSCGLASCLEASGALIFRWLRTSLYLFEHRPRHRLGASVPGT
jgi:hypothetical protein